MQLCQSSFKCYQYSLPWMQETTIGYFGEMCICMIAIDDFYIVSGILLLLFISMSFHHCAFREIYQHSVQKLESTKRGEEKTQTWNELIEFHNLAKR